VSVNAIEMALERSSAKALPTAHVVLSGEPNLREIVAAQQMLLQSLPKFKGFGLKACPNCHSGLDRIVIDFGDPIEKRVSNILHEGVPAIAKSEITI
jgi:hypothetical protein